MFNPVKELVTNFFSRGLEGYTDKQTINPGGARLYWQAGWKKQQRIFINDRLFNAIKDYPANLYIMSRIRLDERGRPMLAKNGTGANRQTIGLMLYSQFNANPVLAQNYVKKILAEVPELEGYVYSGLDLVAEVPGVALVEQLTYRTPDGVDDKLSLRGCVFIIVSSGSEGSAQFWGYRTKSIANRSDLNAKTVVSGTGEDVSLTGLNV